MDDEPDYESVPAIAIAAEAIRERRQMLENDVIVRKHLVTAQIVRDRLDAATKGNPLTADEIVRGVRLDHAEYLDLVERAARSLRQR